MCNSARGDVTTGRSKGTTGGSGTGGHYFFSFVAMSCEVQPSGLT